MRIFRSAKASAVLPMLLGSILTVQASAAEAPGQVVPAPSISDLPARASLGTVRGRPRPDYDAEGVGVGSFRLLPSLSASTVYDSNILRSEDDPQSDIVGTVQARLKLESDWNQHSLAVSGVADLGFHAEHASENYADVHAAAAGRVDILRGLQLELNAGFARLHEPRGSIDGDSGAEPVIFNRWSAGTALRARTGRFRYRLGAGVRGEDFRDVAAVGGGSINHDDRDHRVWDASARVSYEALPDTRVFAAARYARTAYASQTDDAGFARDSHGGSAVLGASADFGGITFGSVYAGWIGQQFEDSRLEAISGLTVGGRVTVNVTPLTTFSLSLDRGLRDTVTDGASAIVDTAAIVKADHELLRNLLLGAEVSGRRLSFQGIDRTDDHWGAGLRADWLLNRWARLSARYGLDLRDSHGSDQTHSWQRHTAMLRLLLQR